MLDLYYRVRAAGMPPSRAVPPYYEQVVRCLPLDGHETLRDALRAAVGGEPEETDDA